MTPTDATFTTAEMKYSHWITACGRVKAASDGNSEIIIVFRGQAGRRDVVDAMMNIVGELPGRVLTMAEFLRERKEATQQPRGAANGALRSLIKLAKPVVVPSAESFAALAEIILDNHCKQLLGHSDMGDIGLGMIRGHSAISGLQMYESLRLLAGAVLRRAAECGNMQSLQQALQENVHAPMTTMLHAPSLHGKRHTCSIHEACLISEALVRGDQEGMLSAQPKAIVQAWVGIVTQPGGGPMVAPAWSQPDMTEEGMPALNPGVVVDWQEVPDIANNATMLPHFHNPLTKTRLGMCTHKNDTSEREGVRYRRVVVPHAGKEVPLVFREGEFTAAYFGTGTGVRRSYDIPRNDPFDKGTELEESDYHHALTLSCTELCATYFGTPSWRNDLAVVNTMQPYGHLAQQLVGVEVLRTPQPQPDTIRHTLAPTVFARHDRASNQVSTLRTLIGRATRLNFEKLKNSQPDPMKRKQMELAEAKLAYQAYKNLAPRLKVLNTDQQDKLAHETAALFARSSKVFNVVKSANDQNNLAALQRLLQQFNATELKSNDAVAGAIDPEELLQWQIFAEVDNKNSSRNSGSERCCKAPPPKLLSKYYTPCGTSPTNLSNVALPPSHYSSKE